MRITITAHELSSPRDINELSIALIGGVHANVYKYVNVTGERIEVDGLNAVEAGIALKIIKPYLDN